MPDEIKQQQEPLRSPLPFVEAQNENRYFYYKEVFGNRPMPFAYLDLDLLEQNIRQIVARAGGKRVRLASKSIRSVAVLRHQSWTERTAVSACVR